MSETFGGDLADGSLRSLYDSDIANGILRDLPGDTLAAILGATWDTAGITEGLDCNPTNPASRAVLLSPGVAVSKSPRSWAHLESERTVPISQAHPTQNRFDLVGLRFNSVTRRTAVDTIPGAPSASASPSRPQPDASFLGLYYIFVPAGALTIDADNIEPFNTAGALIRERQAVDRAGFIQFGSELPDPAATQDGTPFMLTLSAPGFDFSGVSRIYGMQTSPDGAFLYIAGAYEFFGASANIVRRYSTSTGLLDSGFNIGLEGILPDEATSSTTPLGFAVNDNRIYILGNNRATGGTDMFVFDLDGTRQPSEEFSIAGITAPAAIWADNNNIYGYQPSASNLRRADLDGTNSTQVGPSIGGTSDGLAVDVSAGRFYFVRRGGSGDAVWQGELGNNAVASLTQLSPLPNGFNGRSVAIVSGVLVVGSETGTAQYVSTEGRDGDIFILRGGEWVLKHRAEA